MFENISLAFQGIWGHKLRSFLTMLGVIIGIAAIITIVSTINGTNQQIKENLIGAGNNMVNVRLTQNDYEVEMEYGDLPEGVRVIDADVIEKIKAIPGVENAAGYRMRRYSDNIYFKSISFNGTVMGIDEGYFDTAGLTISEGRGFMAEEYSGTRKVVIVDTKTAASLFEGEDPVGSIIEIFGEPFTVVGVAAENSSSEPSINSIKDYEMYSGNRTSSIYIPSESWGIVYRLDEPKNIVIKAFSTDDMTVIGNLAAEILNNSVISSGVYKYAAEDLLKQAAALQSLSETSNRQLIWIAAISLLVGGIGVMNIMLVSVTERTREIGLKIAIGARKRRIRVQFLTEAAVLTLIGGLIGVAAGIGLAYMLSNVMGTPVAISIAACVVAVAFSIVIGIVFGIVPAIKASNLNPIEALRHE